MGIAVFILFFLVAWAFGRPIGAVVVLIAGLLGLFWALSLTVPGP
jgi:hypothetical protein